MTARDHERLIGVHPDLIAKISSILDAMDAFGHPMFVVMGVRTVAQQQALYAQGRTAPGRIVTMKDGVIHRSNHQPRTDGFGHAVDCAFLTSDPFAQSLPWETYGLQVEAAGLTWGGRFTHLVDRPHAEMPVETIQKVSVLSATKTAPLQFCEQNRGLSRLDVRTVIATPHPAQVLGT